MKSALMIGGSSQDHSRVDMDYYPTPPEVTRALMEFLGLEPELKVWEPACGDGAMAEVFRELGHTIIPTDIRDDTGYGLRDIDFLKVPKGHFKVDAIITNPPFAKAAEFIQHAIKQDVLLVAMLVKATFWHAKSRLDLFDNHPPAYVLPLTWRPAFAPGRGKSPTMDFTWVVWERDNRDTRYVPLSKPGKIK